ncbi:hypothetical protein WA026_010780, partial [Henosepilachna vigintioctopunctata]
HSPLVHKPESHGNHEVTTLDPKMRRKEKYRQAGGAKMKRADKRVATSLPESESSVASIQLGVVTSSTSSLHC